MQAGKRAAMIAETGMNSTIAQPARIPRGPERFAAVVDAELEGAMAKRSKLLTTVLSECGYKNRSAQRLQRIQAALVARGIYSRPRLADLQTASHERVEFSRAIYSLVEPDMVFPNERTLELFVLRNYKRIPELSRLKDPKEQHSLPSRRTIDLLFRECRTNDYVVLELKVDDGGWQVVAQLFSYLTELLPVAQAEGCEVRGIILTGKPNALLEDEVKRASEATGIHVDWYCYVASVKLAPLVLTPPRLPEQAADAPIADDEPAMHRSHSSLAAARAKTA